MDTNQGKSRYPCSKVSRRALPYAQLTMRSTKMDTEAIRLWLETRKADLISIAEADRLYRSEREHGREEDLEYRERQEQLKEIRWAIATLRTGAIQ